MLDWLVSLFNKFASALLSLLPHSPFRRFIDNISLSDYVGYINWFIPVHAILVIFNIWLGAVALYYAYILIARWLKLIS